MQTSVLSVTYDGESVENLSRYFQSLADQTKLADQILLILDGPVRPALQAVIDQWQGNLPLDVIIQDKAGLSAGLNLGLKHLKHDVVFRCDTDDINLPDRFATQADLIETTGASVVSAPIREFTEDRTIDRLRSVPLGRVSNHRLGTFFRNPINHNSAAFRLSDVRAVGGYPGGRMEDYRLWLTLLKAGKSLYNASDVVLHAAVDGLGARRVGADYRAAEWQLLKVNAPRLAGLGVVPAAVCYAMRAPLRLGFMAPFLTMLYSKFLRKEVT